MVYTIVFAYIIFILDTLHAIICDLGLMPEMVVKWDQLLVHEPSTELSQEANGLKSK